MFDAGKNDVIKSILMVAMGSEKPSPAGYAEGKLTFGDFLFHYSRDGRASLSRYLGDDEIVRVPGSIRVPGEEKDRPVAFLSIGAFMQKEKVREVYLEEGIEGIGGSAFFCCPVLWEVRLPGSLQDIGEGAFFECPKLESLGVPAGVTFAGGGERDFSLIMGCYDDEGEDDA